MNNRKCHGHINNKQCSKCQFYDPLSFSWQILCKHNKMMFDHSFSTNAKAKTPKAKTPKTKTKVIDTTKKSDVSTNGFFKKGDFYYDFNLGVHFCSKNKSLLVKIINVDTGNVILNIQTEPGKIYHAPQTFYVKWGIQVYEDSKLYFKYELDLKDKEVLIISPSHCLGDNIAFIQAVSTFQKQHQCKVSYLIKHDIREVLKNNYSNINFIKKKQKSHYFASYKVKCGDCITRNETIVHHFLVSLQKVAEYILKVQHRDRQKLLCTETIDFGGKYVVYSQRASSRMKEWNNPQALKEVIKYLQSLNYKVVNLDVEPKNKKIKDVIYLNDKTYTLQDKINVISGADFFIGIPSGLAWLAWACYIPAIVLGGFHYLFQNLKIHIESFLQIFVLDAGIIIKPCLVPT